MFAELILGLIGISFLVAGIIKFRDNTYLKKSGITVKGIVYCLEWRNNYCYPVVRFRSNQELWVTKKLDIGSYPPQYREGAEVTLIYDPANPENVNFDSGFNLLLVPASFILIGSAGLLYVFLSFFDLI